MDGQPLVLSQEDVRVILPRTEIEKLSDEVHEIEIWLGKGEGPSSKLLSSIDQVFVCLRTHQRRDSRQNIPAASQGRYVPL